jgi:hypothetical protein
MTLAVVFSPEFTFGNVLTLALGLASWALTAGKYLADQRSMRETQRQHSDAISALNQTGGSIVAFERSELRRRIDDHEERLRVAEVQLAKIDVLIEHAKYIRKRIDSVSFREEASI